MTYTTSVNAVYDFMCLNVRSITPTAAQLINVGDTILGDSHVVKDGQVRMRRVKFRVLSITPHTYSEPEFYFRTQAGLVVVPNVRMYLNGRASTLKEFVDRTVSMEAATKNSYKADALVYKWSGIGYSKEPVTISQRLGYTDSLLRFEFELIDEVTDALFSLPTSSSAMIAITKSDISGK